MRKTEAEAKGMILKEAKAVFGEGYDFEFITATKNNGVTENKLIIKELPMSETSVCPAYTIDDVIDTLIKGNATVKEIIEELKEAYDEVRNTPPILAQASLITRKEYILKNVQYKLVNRKGNENISKHSPHKDFLDMTALYRVMVNASNENAASYTLVNELMKRENITPEELDIAAKRNTYNAGFYVSSMLNQMREMGTVIPEEEAPIEMYVLSNTSNFYGASTIMYPQILKGLAERIDADLFILPSSIHECLAVSAKGKEARDLREMVHEINNTMLDQTEVLSNQVYKFTRATGSLTIAR